MSRWAAVVLLLVFVVAGTADWVRQQPIVQRVLTRWFPPSAPAGTELSSTREQQALKTLGQQARGRLLWASNRGGNHELYEAELATGTIRQLTRHPHVDFFGRYSPDGSRILFLRSRKEWTSFREIDGWDLYVMKSDGSDVRQLAERAYHPAWIDDNSISFLRANTVIVIDLETGRESTWHDGGAAPTGGDIGDPEPGPDGQLAISLRGVPRERRGVGVLSADRKEYRPVSGSPSACHVVWTPSGGLVWITSEGRGGTRVMHAPKPGGPVDVLIDLPGAYSHEYFPRVSRDGAWLLWGAAAEGHEHDRADYELFAWRIGTPWPDALRLTYSKANDQWPELRLE